MKTPDSAIVRTDIKNFALGAVEIEVAAWRGDSTPIDEVGLDRVMADAQCLRDEAIDGLLERNTPSTESRANVVYGVATIATFNGTTLKIAITFTLNSSVDDYVLKAFIGPDFGMMNYFTGQ